MARSPNRSAIIPLRVSFIFLHFITSTHAFLLEDHRPSTSETKSTISNNNNNNNNNNDNNNENLCLTKECVGASARIESYIDYDVEPCTDFYQFACGRGLKDTVLPKDVNEISWSTKLAEKVYPDMKRLMENRRQDRSEPQSVQQAKNLFASCMDMDTRNRRGNHPLFDFIASEFLGWPLVEPEWTEDSVDITDLLIRLGKSGDNPLFSLTAQAELEQSKGYRLVIEQNNMVDKTHIEGHETAILKLLGAYDEEDTGRMQEIDDFMEFGAKVRSALPNFFDASDYFDESFRPPTIAEFCRNYSGIIDYSRYFKSLFSRHDVDIQDNQGMFVPTPTYFDELEKLLRETKTRSVVNWLIWEFILEYVENLNIAYINEMFSEKYNSDANMDSPCIASVAKHMTHAVGRIYADGLPSSAKYEVESMTGRILDSFTRTIQNSPWLDDVTREAATGKIASMDALIGYRNEFMNDTYLDTIYSTFIFNETTFFENILKLKGESMMNNLKLLRHPDLMAPLKKVTMMPWAMYYPTSNSLEIAAGMLHPPFFQHDVPKYLNYGGIGFTTAHEIGHAFDGTNRKYNHLGKEGNWWSPLSARTYEERAQCYIHQYGKFSIDLHGEKISVKANKTLNENMADFQGLRQSYSAYRHWLANSGMGEERLLPGLSFSQDQLFFLNFAQTWCVKQTLEDEASQIESDVHSPSEFRVRGVVQNLEEFSSVFNCPSGSPMNPEEKCILWD